MCKKPISFNVRRRRHCRGSSLKEIFSREAKSITVKITVLTFLLGACIFLSVVSAQSFNANSNSGNNNMLTVNLGLAIVSVVMAVVLLGLFTWLITVFIRDYFIKTSVEIFDIGESRV